MPSFWSWLSKKKSQDKRDKKTKQSQPGHRRHQTDNLSRNTEPTLWGNPTWHRMDQYSFATDPHKRQGIIQVPRILGPGLRHETREHDQWIIRDWMSYSTLPETNMIYLSGKQRGDTKTPIYRPIYPPIYPQEDASFKNYPSSYHRLIPTASISKIERGNYISSAQREYQLFPLQQSYTPDFRAPQNWSRFSHDHPNVGQVPSLNKNIADGYFPRQGLDTNTADHQKWHPLLPRQDAIRYNVSQRTQKETATTHGRAQKGNHGQVMHDIRRPRGSSDRIVYNYIPKVVGQQDLSGILSGGSIDKLSLGVHFQADVAHDTSKYQSQIPGYIHRYPLKDDSESSKPHYFEGSTTADYTQRYPAGVVQEPPKPDYTPGSTSPNYTQKSLPGHFNNEDTNEDHTRKSLSRNVIRPLKENVNFSHQPGVANSSDHVTPVMGNTKIPPTNENFHFSSNTTSTGVLSGLNEPSYVYNQSHSYRDVENDIVDATPYRTDSLHTASTSRLNNRFQEHARMATNTPSDEFNDDEFSDDDFNDDEVNLALNQLDDATISETERYVIKELECIFQTEGEVLY